MTCRILTQLAVIQVIFLLNVSVIRGEESLTQKKMVDLADKLGQEIVELPMGDFGFDWRENFQEIPELQVLNQTLADLEKIEREFREFSEGNVPKELKYLYEHLRHEIELRRERLALEKKFVLAGGKIPETRLSELANASEWYLLYLKIWLADEIKAEELLDYGYSEVLRVQGEIQNIQEQLGFKGRENEFIRFLNSDRFFLLSEDEIKNKYRKISTRARHGLARVFLDTIIPDVSLRRDPQAGVMRPPGFYFENTFFFNFYGKPYNWRAMDWLYIHEAIPGHHYQFTYSINHPAKIFSKNFNWYFSFMEGWGAYAETLGSEIGLYKSIYSKLGKWEWDLVRSVRVVLDVGLNLKGWSKEKARQFWKENIRGQDAIIEREINRIIKWPVQVITYKWGEREIFKLRKRLSKKTGFDIKKFHHDYLKRGPMPLPALRKIPEFSRY